MLSKLAKLSIGGRGLVLIMTKGISAQSLVHLACKGFMANPVTLADFLSASACNYNTSTSNPTHHTP